MSDVIPDRERGWIESIMIELSSNVNFTAGWGLIIHVLFAAIIYLALQGGVAGMNEITKDRFSWPAKISTAISNLPFIEDERSFPEFASQVPNRPCY